MLDPASAHGRLWRPHAARRLKCGGSCCRLCCPLILTPLLHSLSRQPCRTSPDKHRCAQQQLGRPPGLPQNAAFSLLTARPSSSVLAVPNIPQNGDRNRG